MKLYMNNPPTSAKKLVEQINQIIVQLNNSSNIIHQHTICLAENKKLREETLPIYEEQENTSAGILVQLENKKNQILNQIAHLSPVQIAEKLKLQGELKKIESEIAINYNNYSRARTCVSDIIHKLNTNDEYINENPLEPARLARFILITEKLNPKLEELSKIIKTPLVTYEPNSLLYFEKFEFVNEEKFELES